MYRAYVQEEQDLELASRVGAEMYRIAKKYTQDSALLKEIRRMAHEEKLMAAEGCGIKATDTPNLLAHEDGITMLALIQLSQKRSLKLYDEIVRTKIPLWQRVLGVFAFRKYRRTLVKAKSMWEQIERSEPYGKAVIGFARDAQKNA